jgi:hypothetical protein
MGQDPVFIHTAEPPVGVEIFLNLLPRRETVYPIRLILLTVDHECRYPLR